MVPPSPVPLNRQPPECQPDACHLPKPCVGGALYREHIRSFWHCELWLLHTHCAINFLEPTSTDPTGADKLLLRQMDTESKSRAMRSTLTPKAAAALNTLAPSMCNAMRTVPTPGSRTKAASSSRKERGITLPPQMLCVFSTTTSVVTGSWQSTYCRILCRNSVRLKVPSGWFLIVTNWTPAKCAAPAKQYKNTYTLH